MPRRYGYVPNTLAAMFLVAFFAAPLVRRRLSATPALIALGGVTFLWLTLVGVCIPIIRAQDAKVWRAVSLRMNGRRDSSILFVTSWNQFNQPGFTFGIQTPGVRGLNFPEVFESPLSYYWWESEYAIAVLGARFAAYRYDDVSPEQIKLSGNGLNNSPPLEVSRKSVVVVADLGLRSSDSPYHEIVQKFFLPGTISNNLQQQITVPQSKRAGKPF